MKFRNKIKTLNNNNKYIMGMIPMMKEVVMI